MVEGRSAQCVSRTILIYSLTPRPLDWPLSLFPLPFFSLRFSLAFFSIISARLLTEIGHEPGPQLLREGRPEHEVMVQPLFVEIHIADFYTFAAFLLGGIGAELIPAVRR